MFVFSLGLKKLLCLSLRERYFGFTSFIRSVHLGLGMLGGSLQIHHQG